MKMFNRNYSLISYLYLKGPFGINDAKPGPISLEFPSEMAVPSSCNL